jgi:glycerophosphoryl diester phosphodiesterase
MQKMPAITSFYSANFPRPAVIAHQGGDRLWPGNTLYAFRKSVEMGVDVIETDLRQSKDGVLIISHDESVDRISNGTGRILDLTYTELKELDAGYHWSPDGDKTFPYRGRGITYISLEDVFKTLPEMRFNVDMKQNDPPIDEALCKLIRQYNMQSKVVAASFRHKNMTAFRKLCPEVTTAADLTETCNFVLLNFISLSRLLRLQFQVFQVPTSGSGIPIITRRFIEAAHASGLRVEVWTIDDPEEMRRLLSLGVDGIMSDRPDLLIQVVGR